MERPFISIIIPVYNAQNHIGQCIESVINQSFKDIEIICVDDYSVDESTLMVEKYAKNDRRVRLIKNETNMGALKARSLGVQAATGKYIMFLDNDDEFELNTCEKMCSIAVHHEADIYSFRTKVAGSDMKRKTGAQAFHKSYTGWLYDMDILIKTICDGNATITIWNKMFLAEPCKKAHELIENDYAGIMPPPLGEDYLAFIATAFFSKAFYGIDEPLYRYHYSRGYTGIKTLSLKEFRRYAMSYISVEKCREFYINQGELEKYTDVLNALSNHLLDNCISVFFDKISTEDREKALEIMMRYWPHNQLIVNFGLIASKTRYEAIRKDEIKVWELPYKLLPKGGRIVLYGAGNIGKDYYRQIINSGYCKTVLWVDKNYKSISESGLQVKAPDEIANTEYDRVLVAILDEGIASIIKRYLIETLNVSENHILWQRISSLS